MPGLFDDIPVTAAPKKPGGLFDDIPIAGAPTPRTGPGLFDDIPIAKEVVDSTKALGYDPTDAKNYDPFTGQPFETNTRQPEEDLPPGFAKEKALDLSVKAANGLLLGYGPRLGALSDSDPVGKYFGFNTSAPSYNDALIARLADDQRISNEMPNAARVAEGAGGMLGMAVPGGAAANVARAAPLLGRVAIGVGTGGVIGGVQGSSASSDLTDIPQTLGHARTGAEVGAGFGLGLPLAGALFGAGYRTAVPFLSPAAGMNRTASALLSGAVTPATGARLGELGPQAMLSDTSPAALGLSQGVASKGGAPADVLVDALARRSGGQSDRLLGSLDENLGPAISPRQAAGMMGDRQAAASPMYESALRDAPPVDISPVVQQLENARLYAKGTDASRLDRFATLLRGPQGADGGFHPEFNATALHRAKMEMDAQIAGTVNQTGSAAATATRDMVGVRSALNDVLENQVPGYADANLAYRTAARGGEAFEAGRGALKPGANTLWPQDLDHEFAALPIEQQALYRAGARSDIEAGLGTNRNDLSALNKVVGGENDFNRPKMMTLFGQDQTGNLLRDINSERTFADTYGKIAQGSQTAQRAGNAAAIDAADQPLPFVIPKTASIPGMLGHAGEYLVRKGFGALAQSSGATTRDQLARALTMQGPDAITNITDLSRALMNRQNTADSISAALSHRAALAAALSSYREARQ